MTDIVKHNHVMRCKNWLSINHISWPPYFPVDTRWVCHLTSSPHPIEVHNIEIFLIQLGNHDVHILDITMDKACFMEF